MDINRDALMLAMDRLNFSGTVLEPLEPTEVRLYHGDARNLDLIPDGSIDLIATHPPYANIIKYTPAHGSISSPRAGIPSLRPFGELRAGSGPVEGPGGLGGIPPTLSPSPSPFQGEGDRGGEVGDLSHVRSIAAFVEQMRLVATECYRVLKPDHYCAILVGDTRRNKHYATIAFRVMQAFLEAGFILKEDIIKAQWNTQTEGLWANLSRDKNFLLIMHEHLFVFRKPATGEKLRPYAESMRWW